MPVNFLPSYDLLCRSYNLIINNNTFNLLTRYCGRVWLKSKPQSARFRCCFKGKANNANNNWPKLEPLPQEIINAVRSPIDNAIALSKFYKPGIRTELNNRSDEELAILFNQLSSTICQQTYLLDNLTDFLEKEDRYYQQIIEVRKLINHE
jgi:hypothetical protein